MSKLRLLAINCSLFIASVCERRLPKVQYDTGIKSAAKLMFFSHDSCFLSNDSPKPWHAVGSFILLPTLPFPTLYGLFFYLFRFHLLYFLPITTYQIH